MGRRGGRRGRLSLRGETRRPQLLGRRLRERLFIARHDHRARPSIGRGSDRVGRVDDHQLLARRLWGGAAERNRVVGRGCTRPGEGAGAPPRTTRSA